MKESISDVAVLEKATPIRKLVASPPLQIGSPEPSRDASYSSPSTDSPTLPILSMSPRQKHETLLSPKNGKKSALSFSVAAIMAKNENNNSIQEVPTINNARVQSSSAGVHQNPSLPLQGGYYYPHQGYPYLADQRILRDLALAGLPYLMNLGSNLTSKRFSSFDVDGILTSERSAGLTCKLVSTTTNGDKKLKVSERLTTAADEASDARAAIATSEKNFQAASSDCNSDVSVSGEVHSPVSNGEPNHDAKLSRHTSSPVSPSVKADQLFADHQRPQHDAARRNSIDASSMNDPAEVTAKDGDDMEISCCSNDEDVDDDMENDSFTSTSNSPPPRSGVNQPQQLQSSLFDDQLKRHHHHPFLSVHDAVKWSTTGGLHYPWLGGGMIVIF